MHHVSMKLSVNYFEILTMKTMCVSHVTTPHIIFNNVSTSEIVILMESVFDKEQLETNFILVQRKDKLLPNKSKCWFAIKIELVEQWVSIYIANNTLWQQGVVSKVTIMHL